MHRCATCDRAIDALHFTNGLALPVSGGGYVHSDGRVCSDAKLFAPWDLVSLRRIGTSCGIDPLPLDADLRFAIDLDSEDWGAAA